jgi:hypothetical protein
LLRQAFAAAVLEKDFLADGEKLNFETGAMSWEDTTRIVKETIDAPPNIVARAKAAMGE